MSAQNPPYPKFIATKEQHQAFIAAHETRFTLDGGIYCSRLCNLFAPGHARFEENELECVCSFC